MLYLCLYSPIYEVSKIRYYGKFIAYLEILDMSLYTDVINKPSGVSLKVQMDRNHKTTDTSSLGPDDK